MPHICMMINSKDLVTCIVKNLNNTDDIEQKDEILLPCQPHTWSTGFKCKDGDKGPLLTHQCIPSSPLWKYK